MAKVKHFSGDIELSRIQTMPNKKFAELFPGVKGRRADSFDMYVGMPVSFEPVWVAGIGWTKHFLPVERVVTFKSNPSRHDCDARCINAQGRTMQCECSCGGKNHGAGRFNCTAEAA